MAVQLSPVRRVAAQALACFGNACTILWPDGTVAEESDGFL
ncbi:hypothetical protein [Streptomyces sp.]|nr:hypothetical protein [Streptomyces sp.]HET6360369.1 hypothetical protein [Streptomyces sp.]